MRSSVALVALALLACVPPAVQMVRSGPTVGARPPDCRVAFLRVKAPEQPFDEIAVLQYDGMEVKLAEAQELLRRQACAAGADAVVVTREFTSIPGHTWMAGTGIRYRVNPGQRAILDSPRNLTTEAPPLGYRAVVLKEAAPVYETPALAEPALATLPRGTVLWQLEGSQRGTPPFWENKHNAGTASVEVWLPDGKTGYVIVETLAPYQAPAAPPAKPEADGSI